MIRNGITTVNWEALNSYCRRMEHGQGAPIPGWYTYAGDGVYLNSNGEEVSFDEVFNNYVLPNAGITYRTVITETADYEIASAYFNPSEGEYGVDQLTLYVEWKKVTKTEYSLVPVGGEDGGLITPIGHINNGFGGFGAGMTQFGGTFRLRNSKGFSPKFYDISKITGRGWGGGGRGLIKTYSCTNWGKGIGYGSLGFSLTLGAIYINDTWQQDGNMYGPNTQMAVSQTLYGITGAWMRAEIGASIGAWFGGVGAIPGAVIGGIVGGIFGGWGGSELGEIIVTNF
jgi:hypothetical protein